jgi:hypothetical protein
MGRPLQRLRWQRKQTDHKGKVMKISTFGIGDHVCCDLCNKDFSSSKEEGGFIFSSKGVCPDCAPRFEEDAKRYGEERYIVARANPGESFHDFIMRIRNSDNTITYASFG